MDFTSTMIDAVDTLYNECKVLSGKRATKLRCHKCPFIIDFGKLREECGCLINVPSSWKVEKVLENIMISQKQLYEQIKNIIEKVDPEHMFGDVTTKLSEIIAGGLYTSSCIQNEGEKSAKKSQEIFRLQKIIQQQDDALKLVQLGDWSTNSAGVNKFAEETRIKLGMYIEPKENV